MPPGHPKKADWLNNLGTALQRRFDRLGALEDLESAIAAIQQAVDLMPVDHPDKASFLDSLGNALQRRFDRLGTLDDLEAAIVANKQATDLTPIGHSEKAVRLGNLGSALQMRFDRLGTLDDLELAISTARQAINITPDEHPRKSILLNSLGRGLQRRFKRLGALDDLESAISAAQQAVDIMPIDHPDKAIFLDGLGNALIRRFDRLGTADDLEAAISANQQAVDLTPEGHPNKAKLLSNLGRALQKRFKRFGILDDLESAISAKQRAVDLMPDDHPNKASFFDNLGNALQRRFDQLGALDDLESAISANQQAVNLTPDGHPDKINRLTNLGRGLQRRFERLGTLDDLESAISVKQRAVDLLPAGHPDKASRLNNLGTALHRRFDRLGILEDLESAISAIQQAIELTPDGPRGKTNRLTNLGNMLENRFERLGTLDDLESAISAHQKAVGLTPDGHPDKSNRLSNLGVALQMRFERLGNLDDLKSAISAKQQVMNLTPDGHHARTNRLNNLGNALLGRFHRLNDIADLNAAISVAEESTKSATGPATAQLQGARLWAKCSTLSSTSPLPAFKCAIELLPRVAWLGITMEDQYALLATVGDVVRDAVAAAIDDGEVVTAIEWAEQGRSIVWQNLLSLQMPLDELQSKQPQLYKKLQEIMYQLGGAMKKQKMSDENQTGDLVGIQISLARKQEAIVEEVRQQPGFEDFMQPRSLRELGLAARGGAVVVVNLASSRCDALVLRLDDEGIPRPVVVPLVRASLRKAEEYAKGLTDVLSRAGVRSREIRKHNHAGVFATPEKFFKSLLRTLWLDYVKPVIEALAYQVDSDPLPRIWWCPTGPLAFLPLHAAGIYDFDVVGDKLSDYVISSYAPTLTTLLAQSPTFGQIEPSMLTVALAKTPGGSPLPGTEDEVKRIRHVAPAIRIDSLSNEEATKMRVLEELKHHSWVHLACHGVQTGGDPMSSGILLHDEKLKLSELIKTPLPNAEFAFLSACQTAVGDHGVPEESAHLAAGMLFAGYRGVIATMWSIGDEDGPLIAEKVYERMLKGERPDYEQAAYGLHEATERLRKSGASFTSWVPFIHIGR